MLAPMEMIASKKLEEGRSELYFLGNTICFYNLSIMRKLFFLSFIYDNLILNVAYV